jgi:hypothetical protein
MGVSYPLDGFTESQAPDVAPALLKVAVDAAEAARWKMRESIGLGGNISFDLNVRATHAAAYEDRSSPRPLVIRFR